MNTYFSDTGTEHFVYIKNWLETNATDYFDSFVLSDDKLTLTCIRKSTPVMTFNRGETGLLFNVVFTSDFGASKKESISSTVKVAYVSQLMKTNYGIIIRISMDSDYPYAIFITKTDKNGMGILWMKNFTETGNIYAMSAENSRSISYITSTSYSTSCALTSFAPIVLGESGDYCPNLYFAVFSAYKGTQCLMELDGRNYYSNGWIALRA